MSGQFKGDRPMKKHIFGGTARQYLQRVGIGNRSRRKQRHIGDRNES
ncbi:MAG: hypothetical protein GY820_20590 [Gammaproteobacteria bacterium]|nr:hypothetical protein [Gammaproteobacteria bacterium]